MAVTSDRVGFLRRAAAVAVDVVLVTIVVVAFGLLAGALTDGRLRLSETHIFEKEQCSDIASAVDGVKLPEGFRPTSTSRCVSSVLGYPYDWYLIVQERTDSGSFTFEKTLMYPLDRNGNVVNAIYLDWLILPLLVIAAFIQETTRGDTIGKRLAGLRVQSLRGGLPSRPQVAWRLMRFCYLMPYVLTYAGLIYFTQRGASVAFLSYLTMGGIALTLFALVQFIWTVRKGRLPFYDRWAGTEVVRVNDPAGPGIISEASGNR